MFVDKISLFMSNEGNLTPLSKTLTSEDQKFFREENNREIMRPVTRILIDVYPTRLFLVKKSKVLFMSEFQIIMEFVRNRISGTMEKVRHHIK